MNNRKKVGDRKEKERKNANRKGKEGKQPIIGTVIFIRDKLREISSTKRNRGKKRKDWEEERIGRGPRVSSSIGEGL